MNNITAFDKFREGLSSAQGDPYLTFLAKVIYSTPSGSEHETLEVSLYIATYGYGKILIKNGDILTPQKYHLDFNPDFQEYIFDNKGSLVIMGNSKKMGGKYEVQIISV